MALINTLAPAQLRDALLALGIRSYKKFGMKGSLGYGQVFVPDEHLEGALALASALDIRAAKAGEPLPESPLRYEPDASPPDCGEAREEWMKKWAKQPRDDDEREAARHGKPSHCSASYGVYSPKRGFTCHRVAGHDGDHIGTWSWDIMGGPYAGTICARWENRGEADVKPDYREAYRRDMAAKGGTK